jgi:hypothetical protein
MNKAQASMILHEFQESRMELEKIYMNRRKTQFSLAVG